MFKGEPQVGHSQRCERGPTAGRSEVDQCHDWHGGFATPQAVERLGDRAGEACPAVCLGEPAVSSSHVARSDWRIREGIRKAGYRSTDYTHELVAEIYALLMARRRRKASGRPPWLNDEIYNLVKRLTGWSD